MPSVSAIILTRDSQRTIEACIQAIKPAVDHVIVVDTGSNDDTMQIAKANGAYVYRFEWCDDFSAARNFGDSLATTDWVIHVDSDEILRSEDVGKIRKLCVQYRKSTESVAINIQQINITANGVDIIPITRMFKRGVLVWKGIIHEQLTKKRVEKCHITPSDIGVIHDGYNHNVVNYYDKVVVRNIRLLKQGIEQEPENASYHFHLGRDYKLITEYESAVTHLSIAVKLFEQQNLEVGLAEARKVLEETKNCIVPTP